MSSTPLSSNSLTSLPGFDSGLIDRMTREELEELLRLLDGKPTESPPEPPQAVPEPEPAQGQDQPAVSPTTQGNGPSADSLPALELAANDVFLGAGQVPPRQASLAGMYGVPEGL